MNNIRNYGVSFLIIVVLVNLCIGIYTGLEDKYGIVRDEGQSHNLVERIKDMNVGAGIEKFSNAVYKLVNANFLNPLDILGSLASAGLGILQTLGEIVLLPVTLFGAILDFYYIPEPITLFMGGFVAFVIAVMILQAYIKPFQPL